MKQSEDMQRMKKQTKKFSNPGYIDGPPKGRQTKQTKKIITRIYEEEE